MEKNYQLRNFLFTWNNPGRKLVEDMNESDKQELFDSFPEDEVYIMKARSYLSLLYHTQELPIQFITYGIENGENTGTTHFQGYVELNKRVSFSRVANIFGNCHIERRMGTQQQAIDYCRKDGYVTTFGTPKVQGDRTDLQCLKQLLDDSSSIKTLLNNGDITNAQSLRVAEKLLRYTDKPRDFPPEVLWLYGASGTGKTRLAMELLPDAYFKTNASDKWWPNYDSEEDVIIDDLRSDNYPFINLLGLLDRYPFSVEDKGTIRQFRGRRIIITAPLSPEHTYQNVMASETHYEDINQLLRRITLVEKI